MTSITQNPDGTFTLPGGETAKIVTTLEIVAPAVGTPPVVTPPVPAQAAFSAKVDGLTVTFSDESTGDVASVQFDPGNGGTPKPCPVGGTATFQYAKPGSYTIIWMVTGQDGKLSKKWGSVTVGAPPANNPPAPPVSPPTPPAVPTPPVSPPRGATGSVSLKATLADSTAVQLSFDPGERVPLVAGNLNAGSVVCHADGRSVCIEDAYAGTTSDLTGHFTLAADQTLFDGDLTIWSFARALFWLKEPTVDPNADLSGLPQYGPGGESASCAAQYAKSDTSVMGIGLGPSAFGNTGEAGYLGPLPLWAACYLKNPTPENLAVVLGMGRAASAYRVHVIDPKTQRMLRSSDYPAANLQGIMQYNGARNPITPTNGSKCPVAMAQAQAHATMIAVLASALTGADAFREEVSHWCNYYQCLWTNPGYRLPAGCADLHNGQIRGRGRGLLYNLYATKYSDEPEYFTPWVDATIDAYAARIASQTGVQIDQQGAFDYAAGAGIPPEWAPFMQWEVDYAIGVALDYGFSKAQPILDYFSARLFDSLLTAAPEFATLYQVAGLEADGKTPVANWARAISRQAEYNPKVAAAIAAGTGNPGMQQAFGLSIPTGSFLGGDDPDVPDGYGPQLQMALAPALRHATDQTRAKQALAAFTAHNKANYANNPKYNIALPRAA